MFRDHNQQDLLAPDEFIQQNDISLIAVIMFYSSQIIPSYRDPNILFQVVLAYNFPDGTPK